MCARSMTRSERSSMPQSQATATLPEAPSGRGTSFQPVPLQSEQFSSAMRTAYVRGGLTASCLLWENCGREEKGSAASLARFASLMASPGGASPAPTQFYEVALRGFLGDGTLGSTREARGGAHDGVAGFFVLGARRRNTREFLLHDGGELRHLAFHFDHFFAHVQNDFNPREVYAHVARQRQDHVEAFEIGVGVEPGISLGAGGLQQTDALVEAQRLRMQLVQLRYRADHIAGFGSFSCSLWHGVVLSTRRARQAVPLHSCFRE